MANIFILLMDKPMRSSSGFTLVETLLSLSIILMISHMTFHYHKLKINDDKSFYVIEQCIDEARIHAMLYKDTTQVIFDQNMISYASSQYSDVLNLPKNYNFHKDKLAFNEFGHINKGKTIVFSCDNHKYKIIFQLGSGLHDIRKNER